MAALCVVGAVQKPSAKKTSLSDSELRTLAKAEPDVKNAGLLYSVAMATSNNVERKQAYLKVAAACLVACGKLDIYQKYVKRASEDATEFESELKDDCKQCSGTGKKSHRCFVCSGKGMCSVCKGNGQARAVKYSGFHKYHVSKPCGKCKSSGRCSKCGGKGVLEEKCMTCAGTGKAFSKAVAARVFQDSCNAIADGMNVCSVSHSAGNPNSKERSNGLQNVAKANSVAQKITMPKKGKATKNAGQITFTDGSVVNLPYGMTQLTVSDIPPKMHTGRGRRDKILKISVPNSVRNIDTQAFACCRSLKDVTIPDSVTKIGPRAFSECENLTAVTIPDSVESIGEGAFYRCKMLKSAKLPSRLKRVQRDLFERCSSLESVIIPLGVTNIESSAFSHCPSLKSVSIPDTVDVIDAFAFDKTCRLEKSEVRRNADHLAAVRKAEAEFVKRCKTGNGTAMVSYNSINYASIENTQENENFVVISDWDNPNDYAYSILIFPTSESRDNWYAAVRECAEKIKSWVRISAENKVDHVSKEIPIYTDGNSDEVYAFNIVITGGKGQGDLMRGVIREPISQLMGRFPRELVRFRGVVKTRDFNSYSVYISMICGDSFNRTIFGGSGTLEEIDKKIVTWLTIVNPKSLENARKTQSKKEDMFK